MFGRCALRSPLADVVSQRERLKKTMLFKKRVNDALRAGLNELDRSKKPKRYSLTAVNALPHRTDLDNVAEVEGDRFR
jgi:hypothetical protein